LTIFSRLASILESFIVSVMVVFFCSKIVTLSCVYDLSALSNFNTKKVILAFNYIKKTEDLRFLIGLAQKNEDNVLSKEYAN